MQAPQPLAQVHDLSAFDCGEPILNEWLKRRAFANQVTGASRTFVVVGERNQVLAYYALAAGAVAHADAARSVRRNILAVPCSKMRFCALSAFPKTSASARYWCMLSTMLLKNSTSGAAFSRRPSWPIP
jgi:hypothetical protein